MRRRLFTTFWLILFTVAGWSQQDRAIRDTGGGAGGGGIYDPGDGTLPEDVRASGGPNEYRISFDSVTYLQIMDYDEGMGLRIFQGTEGATKFARGIVYSNGVDSLTINITDAGNVPFTIDATSELWLDSKRIVISPDSTEMDWGNATFTDQRASYSQPTHGIKYSGVNLGDLVSTSLVPKAYVDQEVSGAGGTTAYGKMYGSDTGDSFTTSWARITGGSISGTGTGGWTFDGTNDELDYTGSNGVLYKIEFHISGFVSSANMVTLQLYENGATPTQAIAEIDCLNTSTRYMWSGADVVSVNNGDSFAIGGFVQSGSTTFDTATMNVVITKLVGQ